MADNLKIEQAINATLKARKKEMAAISASLKQQITLASTLNEVMGGASLDEAIEKTKEMRESMASAAEAAQSMGDQSDAASQKIVGGLAKADEGTKGFKDRLGQAASEFPKAGILAASFGSAAVSTFKGIMSVAASLGSVIAGAGKHMFKLGRSILAIPGQVLGFLIKDGNALKNMGIEITRAWEEVRGEFGDLASTVGKDITGAFHNLGSTIGATGLSSYTVLGKLQDRIKYLGELFKGMGETVHQFSQELKVNAGAIVTFQKGLGIATEDMDGLAQKAITTGSSLTETMGSVANYSLQLGKTFGVPAKMIGRDIGKMVKDVSNFGSMTIKQMAQSSVFARKLGVDVKKLAGVFSAFDNFEDAAVGAAKLSQAFGMNVDALGMMQEQDVGKRIDSLRKSFFAAGKDAAKMSRQELKLLASTTGLDEATAKNVFSLENQATAYDDIASEGDKAEKQQNSLEDSMKSLADSIKRVVHEGHEMGGFFEEFTKGMRAGIRFSPGYLGMLSDIRKNLYGVRMDGMNAGRAFVKHFPGVNKMFEGLRTTVAAVTKMFRSATGHITQFFRDLGSMTPEKAMQKLLEKLKKVWDNGLTGILEGKGQMKEGFKKFGKALASILAGMTPFIMKGLTKGVELLTEFIEGPVKFIKSRLAKKSGDAGTAGIFDPFVAALKKSWPKLRKALVALWGTVKAKAKPIFQKAMKWLFITFLAGTLLKGIFTSLAGLIGKGLLGALKGGAGTVKGGSKLVGKLLGKSFKVLGPVGAIVGASLAVGNAMKTYTKGIKGDFSEADKQIGAGTAGLVDAITLGLLPDGWSQTIAQKVTELSDAVFKALDDQFGKGFGGELKKMLGSAFDVFGKFGNLISEAFKGGDTDKAGAEFGEALKKYMIKAAEWTFTKLLPTLIGMIGKLFKGISGAISGLFSGAVVATEDIPVIGPIIKALAGIWDIIAGILDPVFELFSSLGDMVMGKINPMQAMNNIADSVEKGFEKIGTGIKKFFVGAIEAIIGPGGLGKIGEFLGTTWEAIKEGFVVAWEWIKGMATTLLSILTFPIRMWIKGFQAAWKFIVEVKDKIIAKFTELKDGAVQKFEEIVTGIKAKFSKVKAILGNVFKAVVNKVKGVGKKIIKGLLGPVVSALRKVAQSSILPDFAKNMAKDFIGAWDAAMGSASPSKVFIKKGHDVIDGLAGGMKDINKTGIKTAKSFAAGFTPALDKDIGAAADALGKQLDATKAKAIAIKPKLEAVLGKRGVLGKNGKLRVENDKQVINVQFDIKMDTDDVKTALTGQKGANLVTRRNGVG
jgi:hypothetical protein